MQKFKALFFATTMIAGLTGCNHPMTTSPPVVPDTVTTPGVMTTTGPAVVNTQAPSSTVTTTTTY